MSQPGPQYPHPHPVATAPVRSGPGWSGRRRTGLIVGIAAVVLVLLAGLGIGAGLVLSALAGIPAAAPSPSRTIAPDFDGDLRTLLLTRPGGTTTIKTIGAADGTVSIADAATEYEDRADGLAVLESWRFERGAAVAWEDGDGYRVQIHLFQFRTAGHAASWFAHKEVWLAGDPTPDRSGRIAEIPQSRWSAYNPAAGADKDGFVYVGFTKDVFAVSIYTAVPGRAFVDWANGMAVNQYEQLPD